jgi:hypothetical protein
MVKVSMLPRCDSTFQLLFIVGLADFNCAKRREMRGHELAVKKFKPTFLQSRDKVREGRL